MKKKQWAQTFSLIDEKYVEEADPAHDAGRISAARRIRRRVIAIAACAAAVFLGLVLFIPYRTEEPDVSRYAGNEYYAVIQRLQYAQMREPRYRNNLDYLLSNSISGKDVTNGSNGTVVLPDGRNYYYDGITDDGTVNTDNANTGSYRETTDNQVAGAIEGDLLKRTDTRIYHMDVSDAVLRVYSLQGENSVLLGSFDLTQAWTVSGYDIVGGYDTEMYLSADGRHVTVVTGIRLPGKSGYDTCTVILLDVTDPAAIRTEKQVVLSGTVVTSRLTGDGQTLLLMTSLDAGGARDYTNTLEFVPCVDRGDGQGMCPLTADRITVPAEVGGTVYSTLTVFDAETLEVRDSRSVLGGSLDAVYVNDRTVYLAWRYTLTETVGLNRVRRVRTGILGIACDGGELTVRGSVALDGVLHNQYSMDERDGILRVVTGTDTMRYTAAELVGQNNAGITRHVNANLYCVSLAADGWEVVGQDIGFAPDGESPQSVRFDGQYAYVCTAVTATLTDPVYFFDLSDPAHITRKDTGTIVGFSHSLVQLPDGNLLGLGTGSTNGVFKAEVYAESAAGVTSVCTWTRATRFSRNYKAYLIDREAGLFGVPLYGTYVLLRYDGHTLTPVLEAEMPGSWRNSPDFVRAFLADGWLYIFNGDSMTVRAVGT